MYAHALRSTVVVALIASFAFAQRTAAPAPALLQDPNLKLPAPPAPLQAPIVREPRDASVVAPTQPKFPELDAARALRTIPRDALYFGARADGSPQVHGRTYKAEFTPEGATYVPYCGPKAPSHPLSFRIASLETGAQALAFDASAGATRSGTTVSYARGSVTEVYELGLDSIEQKFVFDSLPASGELALRLECASELAAASVDGAILFQSEDGSVRYGAATVLDARGASVPALTELAASGLEIRVPAEFLAHASFPVTIDPVITTFSVNWGGTGYDDFAPAISWDESNQRWCTVFEETFSSTDHDVVYVWSDPLGNFLYAGYVETGLGYWANPDVANNNNANQFYVVAEAGLPGSGTRTVHGRTLDALSAALGADVDVSAGGFGEQLNPSVGGDPFLGTSYYTVVWQRIYSAGIDEDVHARQVDTAGTLVGPGTIMIDNSGGTLDRHPRISKSCQYSGTHHVVWERWVAPLLSDVYGAEINWAGTITVPTTAIITGGATSAVACSPIDNLNNWMLVCQIGLGSDRDIYCKHLTGLVTNDTLNLSFIEHFLGAGNLAQDQINPAVDTDGNHFAISYSERFSSSPTDYDVYVSTVDYVAGTLMVGEFHQYLTYTSAHEDLPRLCSPASHGGSGNRIGLAWLSDSMGGTLRDVGAGVYATGDFTKLCSPSNDGVMGCPCGNPPTTLGRGCNNSSATGGGTLEGSGNASLSGDTALLTTHGEKPTATSVVAQGPGFVSTGVAFGQGVRCAGPAGGIGLKRLYTKTASGGSISAPVGADASIHARSAALGDPLSAGAYRYYYVYYRDPIALGGCSAASTFNATDTLQILWRP